MVTDIGVIKKIIGLLEDDFTKKRPGTNIILGLANIKFRINIYNVYNLAQIFICLIIGNSQILASAYQHRENAGFDQV